MKKQKPDVNKFMMALSPVRWYYKLLLKGEKVRCNVCGSNFDHFRTTGFHKRENAMCPECYSLESTRLLWFYLTDEVLGRKNKNQFLCFSPEPIIIEKLKTFDIKLIISNLDYLNSLSVSSLYKKLPGGKADVILLGHVLEYVNNEELVFEELKRLLRPGGSVLIQTIINWQMERTYENPKTAEDKDRLNEFFEPEVKRIYGADFQKHLIKAGFEVEKIDYADQLGNSAREYYQLGNGSREIIFRCKKI